MLYPHHGKVIKIFPLMTIDHPTPSSNLYINNNIISDTVQKNTKVDKILSDNTSISRPPTSNKAPD